jgi:hypothetical protein
LDGFSGNTLDSNPQLLTVFCNFCPFFAENGEKTARKTQKSATFNTILQNRADLCKNLPIFVEKLQIWFLDTYCPLSCG